MNQDEAKLKKKINSIVWNGGSPSQRVKAEDEKKKEGRIDGGKEVGRQ